MGLDKDFSAGNQGNVRTESWVRATIPDSIKENHETSKTFENHRISNQVPENVAKRNIGISNISQGVGEKSSPFECNLKKSLKSLNKEVNSRYSTEKTAARLIAKFKDPSLIKQIMNRIEKKDVRFNGSDKRFELDKVAFENIKFLVESSTKAKTRERVDSKVSKVSDPILSKKQIEKIEKKYSKLEKQMAAELVGVVVQRKPIKSTAGNKNFYLSQQHGYIQRSPHGVSFQKNKAVSAEMQKKEDVSEIANHAIISFSNDKNQTEVVCSRSSRTDTPQKIKDKSTADILARLETNSKKGLTKVLDSQGNLSHYTYQRSDVTLMDSSILKAIATTIMSGISSFTSILKGKGATNIENERKFVSNKKQAVHKLMEREGITDDNGLRYIEHELVVNGIKTKVREYEPLVFNFVFSGQAKDPDNVKNARQDNIKPALTLFKTFVNNNKNFSSYKELIEQNDKQALIDALKRDINSKKYQEKADINMALKGLLITLTGEDEKGRHFDSMDNCDTQFLIINNLSNLAGLPISVECKSGNDRTATSMALICAQKEFSESNGYPFDPTNSTENSAQYQGFKQLFNKYILEFATPNLAASRGVDENGKSDIKTAKSPPFLKYHDEAITQDKLNII